MTTNDSLRDAHNEPVVPPPWQPAGARKRHPESGALDEALADIRRKIYPRSVTGWFARWRVALVVLTQLLFYGLPWLQFNDRQAVLFDLAARKFYIFGMVLWPQDVIYLSLLLIISALALFLFTAVAGRLFCGYACPQTVYTEIFMWIERQVEGDRIARIRRDESPLSFAKFRLKATKHFFWLMVAFWTGFTFIGYFAPIRSLGANLMAFTLGPWQWFWLLFYSFATWGNAGFLREQVCKYMCPYARFQSVMVDADTYVVTYDALRGEPRGPRAKTADLNALGLGDCVDCSICVQVCPTGIDIRRGLQYMCIGCGACIDACNKVMSKVGYPKGLVRYTSERGVLERLTNQQVFNRLRRPRVLIYATLLAIITAVFVAALYVRPTLRVDVIRDRGALGREVPGGFIENVYRLQIINASESGRVLTVSAQGLPGLAVSVGSGERATTDQLPVSPTSNRLIPLVIQAPIDAAAPGAYPITIVTQEKGLDGEIETEVREASSFIFPR